MNNPLARNLRHESPRIPSDVLLLLSGEAVRSRCHQLLQLGLQGRLDHFEIRLEKLEHAVQETVKEIRQNYPSLEIPFHSRLRHLKTGAIDRTALFETLPLVELKEDSPTMSTDSVADVHKKRMALKSWVEWTIISVLLDAGAGPKWQYEEAPWAPYLPSHLAGPFAQQLALKKDNSPGVRLGRSEGLCVASLDLYRQGFFALDSNSRPCQIHGERLLDLTLPELAKGLQSDLEKNPLLGLEGRLALLKKLGQLIVENPKLFPGHEKSAGEKNRRPRLGDFLDYLIPHEKQATVDAGSLLTEVLMALSPIWPGRLSIDGFNLGDTWQHSKLKAPGATDKLVPFHKLSQWMVYSLLDVFQNHGIRIENLSALTGLPEYRNGGLLMDCGVLQLQEPRLINQDHDPTSELIVEWRALTVGLLDLVADGVRKQLFPHNPDEGSLPLVKVLEGGTWSAGRRLAKSLRPPGDPPLKIISDGTIF